MSTNLATHLKNIPARRVVVILLIGILAVTVTTGFVWMQTNLTIAPPGLRVEDWLWRVFICRCPA